MPKSVVKHVRFDGSKIYAPLSKAKTHFSILSSLWLNRDGKGDELEEILNNYIKKGLFLSEFFLKEGEILLDWALISDPEVEPLRFIINHIPPASLLEVLKKDSYALVNSFLMAETAIEKSNHFSKENLNSRVEKIKLFFSLNEEGLKLFLKEALSNENIGQGVKNSIAHALNETEAQSGFLPKAIVPCH